MSLNGLTTTGAVIALVTGLIGLIMVFINTFILIRAERKLHVAKEMQNYWEMITDWADTAMKIAEAGNKTGAEKKQYVLNAVRTNAESKGIRIELFSTRLSAYIDVKKGFINEMQKRRNEREFVTKSSL